LIDSKYVRLF